MSAEMEDSVSSSSYYTSSFPHEGCAAASSDSVTELSRKFSRTALQPRIRSLPYDTPPSKVPDVNSSRPFSRGIPSTNSSYPVRQDPPIATHHQHRSPYFLRMYALVEGLSADEQTPYEKSISSSRVSDGFSPSQTQQAISSMPSTSASPFRISISSSENSEADSYRCSKRQCGDGVNGDLRPPSLGSMTRKNVVLRSIRMRRSFHKRRSLESAKRGDR